MKHVQIIRTWLAHYWYRHGVAYMTCGKYFIGKSKRFQDGNRRNNLTENRVYKSYWQFNSSYTFVPICFSFSVYVSLSLYTNHSPPPPPLNIFVPIVIYITQEFLNYFRVLYTRWKSNGSDKCQTLSLFTCKHLKSASPGIYGFRRNVWTWTGMGTWIAQLVRAPGWRFEVRIPVQVQIFLLKSKSWKILEYPT